MGSRHRKLHQDRQRPTASRLWSRDISDGVLGPKLEYVLKEATDSTLVFEGRNDSATSTDTIVVTPAADGAKIHYRADLEIHGLAVVMARR